MYGRQHAGSLDIVGGLDINGNPVHGHAGALTPQQQMAMNQSMIAARQAAMAGQQAYGQQGYHPGLPQGSYPGAPPGYNPAAGNVVAWGPQTHAVDRAPSHRIRKQMAPLPDQAGIPTLATNIYSIQPQRGFRPDRLILADTVGAATLATVRDIQVAQKSQFISSGSVPFVAFSATAFDATFRFETAEPGIYVTVAIFNGNGSTDTVNGVFFGESLDV